MQRDTSAPLLLDDGEVKLQAEGGGVRLRVSVDEHGNEISHLLSTEDLDGLRRWLDGPKKRSTALSPHDFMLLDRWGRQVYEAFNQRPYLVGSVERGERQWRDVDVRVCLPEDGSWLVEFDDIASAIQSLRLRTVNLAVSLWGRQVTGLPVDFQFQPDAEFHSYDGQIRGALGISVNATVTETWDRRQAIFDQEHPDGD